MAGFWIYQHATQGVTFVIACWSDKLATPPYTEYIYALNPDHHRFQPELLSTETIR